MPTGMMLEGKEIILGQREANGFQRLTSISASTALTVPAGSRLCLIQPETQDIRWRDDGTAPTATIGNLIKANDVLEYNGQPELLKIIEVTASATVNVNYYR